MFDVVVYDECMWMFGDFWVEVVLDYLVGCFGQLGFVGFFVVVWCVDCVCWIEMGIDVFWMVYDDCF